MNLRPLSDSEVSVCLRTIAPHAFYALCVDALLRKLSLSVIRVSDGEKAALDYCTTHGRDDLLLCLDAGFRQRFGCEGITCGEIQDRIESAARNCLYFSPSFGFFNPIYDLLPYFDMTNNRIVEGLFQYEWSRKMKVAIFKAAGHVTIINRNSVTANAMGAGTGVKISWVELADWRGAEAAKQRAIEIGAPLVLMSAALASKYIGPEIAKANKSVVLDIGQAADVWWL